MGRQEAGHTKVESGKVESRKQPQLSIRLGRVIWHPVTLMATALTLSLSVASIATFEMLKVDPSPQPVASSPSSDALTTGLRSHRSLRAGSNPENRDSLPIASLTAVAISCAAGSFLLCRCVWTRKPDRRMTLSSSHKRTAYASGRSNAAARANALPQEQSSQSQPQTAPITATTIVPASEAHPLDWNEPSIADNLDLRQKRPLSHWL